MRRIDINQWYKETDQNEFYTSLEVVQKLLEKYGHLLNGKRVHCPADDGSKSYFYKELKAQFTKLNLKGLMATGFVENGNGIRYTFDGAVETVQTLKGDGSYLSEESLEVTNNWADAIVTNPPFTKYGKFWAIIKDKTFIVIAPALVFTSAKYDIWIKALDKEVYLDNDMPGFNGVNGKVSKVIAITTGFPYGVEPQKKQMSLTKKYDPNVYNDYFVKQPDILNIDRLKDIPYDYIGKMGVPLGAIYFDTEKQFKILGAIGNSRKTCDVYKGYEICPKSNTTKSNGKVKFFRFIIQLTAEYIEQRKKEMQDILNKKENKNEKEDNN